MSKVAYKQWIVPVEREEDWDAFQPGDETWFCVSGDPSEVKVGDKLFLYRKDAGIFQLWVNGSLPKKVSEECSHKGQLTVTAQLSCKMVKPLTVEDLKGNPALAGLNGLEEGFPEGGCYGIHPGLWEPFREFVMKLNPNIIHI